MARYTYRTLSQHPCNIGLCDAIPSHKNAVVDSVDTLVIELRMDVGNNPEGIALAGNLSVTRAFGITRFAVDVDTMKGVVGEESVAETGSDAA